MYLIYWNTCIWYIQYKYNAKSVVDNSQKQVSDAATSDLCTYTYRYDGETFSISVGGYWYPNKWIMRVFTTTRTANTFTFVDTVLKTTRSRHFKTIETFETLRIEDLSRFSRMSELRISFEFIDKDLKRLVVFFRFNRKARSLGDFQILRMQLYRVYAKYEDVKIMCRLYKILLILIAIIMWKKQFFI